jgi:hypothetical protein
MADDGLLHDIARRWADALNERDVDAMLALSTEDVDCDPLQISVSGRYIGHEGVRRWMREVTTHDPGHYVDVKRLATIGEDRVAIFGELVMHGKVVSPYTMVTIVEDRKVAVMRSYLTDEDTLRTLGLLE